MKYLYKIVIKLLVSPIRTGSIIICDVIIGLIIMNTKMRILYWKEIPIQIQTQDESEKISILLDPCFQEAADSLAMLEGSYGTDDYLDGWQWSDEVEVLGDARDSAKSTTEYYNSGFPRDLLSRLRDLHKEGKRDTRPGAIDQWFES